MNDGEDVREGVRGPGSFESGAIDVERAIEGLEEDGEVILEVGGVEFEAEEDEF